DYLGMPVVFGDFWEYDQDSNTWTQRAAFYAKTETTAFAIATKGYIGMGIYRSNHLTLYYNDFFEYDPATDTWTQKASLGSMARYGAVGLSIGTKGYIGTGYGVDSSGSHLLNDFWE